MKHLLSVLALSCGLALAGCPSSPKRGDTSEAHPPTTKGVHSVTTTPSGLTIEVLKEGTGPAPQPGQTVVVHYTGWLTNGKKFDSSVDRGEPFKFVLGRGQVIKGWDEGVAAMKVGEKVKLTIPPDLAYGNRDVGGGLIPPNSTLVFDVELLGIQ